MMGRLPWLALSTTTLLSAPGALAQPGPAPVFDVITLLHGGSSGDASGFTVTDSSGTGHNLGIWTDAVAAAATQASLGTEINRAETAEAALGLFGLGFAGGVNRTPASRFREDLSVREFGAACDGVTDDSKALAAAATALRNTGDRILVPGNCRLLLNGAAQPDLQGVSLVGRGVRELGVPGQVAYGQQGSSVLLGSRTTAPLLVGSDWSISGLNFFWPGQTEAAAEANGNTPITYPALLTPDASGSVYNWRFDDNQVENAFDVADFSSAPNVGHGHWDHNKEFALDAHLIFGNAGGEVFVEDNQFSPIAYLYGVLGTTGNVLESYAGNTATVIKVVGNGTAKAQGSDTFAGLRFANNYVFIARYGIRATGGTLNLATLTGNGFDGVLTPLQADNGGALSQVDVSGGTWICVILTNTTTAAPAVNVATGAAPGNRLFISDVNVSPATGSGIEFNDSGSSVLLPPVLSIAGGTWDNLGNVNVGNPYDGIDFNAPNGTLTVEGTRVSTHATGQTAAYGLVITAAKAAHVGGTVFDGWATPMVVNAGSGTITVTGDSSINSTASTGTAAILGGGAGLAIQAGNAWDLGGGPVSLSGPTGGEVGSATSDGYVGAATIMAPAATTGYAHLPAMSASPTAVPASSSGAVPCVINAGSGNLDCYYGAAWHHLAFGAGAA